jgi:hypothetical protein
MEDYRSIQQIWSGSDVGDPVENDGALGIKQRFLLICVQCAHAKAAPGRKTTKGIGEPWWHTGKVVEREYPGVLR